MPYTAALRVLKRAMLKEPPAWSGRASNSYRQITGWTVGAKFRRSQDLLERFAHSTGQSGFLGLKANRKTFIGHGCTRIHTDKRPQWRTSIERQTHAATL